MQRTFQSMALGALGALALAALFIWLSDRAQSPRVSGGPARPTHEAPPAGSGSLPPASSPIPAQPAPRDAAPQSEEPPGRNAGSDDEASLMSELRAVQASNPTRAVELARAGNHRFPDSPDAAERASILIHALSALGRASEARGEAEHMVNHYPDNAWVREVERFTGAHRHRNVRLDGEGRLEYY